MVTPGKQREHKSWPRAAETPVDSRLEPGVEPAHLMPSHISSLGVGFK